MAFDNIKISDLDNIVTISNSDLIELASPASTIYSMYMSKKTPIDKIGEWLCTVFSFSQTLQTTTKTIVGALNELFNKKELPQGAGFHNSIYRGQYLGQHPTEAQLEAINNGTFDNLFIGDYWSSNESSEDSVKYRIAAFDYYYGIGKIPCTKHHVVIIPDQCRAANTYNNAPYENYTQRGGYKYSWCRGNYYYQRYYTTSEENQTTFNLDDDHYTGCPNVEFVCCISMVDPTVTGGNIIWDIDEEPSGNDCIVKIKGGNNFHATNLNSTYNHYGIPAGTQLTVFYKGKLQGQYFQPTSYPLTFWELLINSDFVSSDYILDFPLLATVDSTNQPGLMTTEWTNGKIELMTEQQVNGARTIGVNNNFETDIIFTSDHFQYNRQRFETTVDSIQFPLFRLNPGLRQIIFYIQDQWGGTNKSGYWYWLRDMGYEKTINWTDGVSALQNGNHKTRGNGLYYSGVWGGMELGGSYGIRPYFCLAKPQVQQGVNE